MGKLRRTSVDIVHKCNDGWLNKYNENLMLVHGGNCDVALLVDENDVLNYVVKYASKMEESSLTFNELAREAIKKAADVEAPGKTIMRVLFLGLVGGGREKSLQEVSHLLHGLPMVKCSNHFIFVNLKNDHRAVDMAHDTEEETEPDEAPKLKQTMIDLYALRNDHKQWESKDDRQAYNRSVGKKDLTSHVARHTSAGGFIQRLAKDRVVVWLSGFWATPLTPHYREVLYHFLLKNKPWIEEPYNVLIEYGPDVTREERKALVVVRT
jgi:hypothetical protein